MRSRGLKSRGLRVHKDALRRWLTGCFQFLSGIILVSSRFACALLIGLAPFPMLVHVPTPNLRGTRLRKGGRCSCLFVIIRNGL